MGHEIGLKFEVWGDKNGISPFLSSRHMMNRSSWISLIISKWSVEKENNFQIVVREHWWAHIHKSLYCAVHNTKNQAKDEGPMGCNYIGGATARWAIQWVALCDFWEASVETKGEWLRVSTGGAL